MLFRGIQRMHSAIFRFLLIFSDLGKNDLILLERME